MKAMLKKSVLLIISLCCTLAFAGCGEAGVIERLKKRYNVQTQLISDYEILCDVTGDTFGGRAPRYAVIAVKKEPTEFLNSFSNEKSDGFSSEKNSAIRELIESHSCMDIPDGLFPDWEGDYSWIKVGEEYDGIADALYIIYFPVTLKLVFFETGH